MSEYLKKKIKWHKKIYAQYLNENNESVDIHYTAECNRRKVRISM